MPKPRAPPQAKLNVNYWQNFLRKKNLVGPVMEIEQKEPQSPPPQQPTVDDDMQIFIDRVAEALIPIHNDYTPDIRTKLHTQRQRIRRELEAVFNGKQTLDQWFTKTRQELGIHQIDMTRKLYDALKGLKSKEARTLRMQYAQALQRLIGTYNPLM